MGLYRYRWLVQLWTVYFIFPVNEHFAIIFLLFLQHYIKLTELEKNRKLNDLLDALDFNQVVIFVKSVSRAAELNKLLVECNFPSICIHSGMSQEERHVYFLKLWQMCNEIVLQNLCALIGSPSQNSLIIAVYCCLFQVDTLQRF